VYSQPNLRHLPNDLPAILAQRGF